MSDELFCCEWCGDEYERRHMATIGLCHECYDVADDVSSDALLPLPGAATIRNQDQGQ